MKNAGFFEDGPVSLAAAYERLFGELRARIDIARAIMSETGDVLSNQSAVRKAITSVAGENPEHLLFREIQEKLKGLVQQLEAKFQPSFSDAELAELRSLDQLYLADPKTGSLHYEMRWSLYDKAVTASPPITYARTLDLIGQDWKPLADVFAGIARIREQVQNYHGLLDEKAITICKYCLARAERVHSDEFCQAYLDQAKTSLRAAVRFPLIWTWLSEQDALKPGNLVPAVNLIDKIKNDLGSPAFEGIKSPFKQPLADLRKRLDTLDPIRQALLTPEKHLRLCTVVLLNRNDQFRLSGQQIAMDTYKAIELRVGTIDHATPVKKGVIGRLPSDSPSDVEIGKFTLYEPFHFHFYFTMGDSRIAADIPAPANWTALRLLSERNARRLDGGRRWQFTINPAPGKLLWFELRFDAPLPELDDWPTAESIGIKP
jgi:hypothetical protein